MVGRFTTKICASLMPCRIPFAFGISCMAVSERWPQSVSLMKAMPTFSLLPTKLKPSMPNTSSISLPIALCFSRSRTSFMTRSVFCSVEPGGRLTSASTKPWSSSGTNEVGSRV